MSLNQQLITSLAVEMKKWELSYERRERWLSAVRAFQESLRLHQHNGHLTMQMLKQVAWELHKVITHPYPALSLIPEMQVGPFCLAMWRAYGGETLQLIVPVWSQTSSRERRELQACEAMNRLERVLGFVTRLNLPHVMTLAVTDDMETIFMEEVKQRELEAVVDVRGMLRFIQQIGVDEVQRPDRSAFFQALNILVSGKNICCITSPNDPMPPLGKYASICWREPESE